MNYIKEINAFYVEIETNPLSASAIALWYALIQVNNRACWIEQFSVAVSVLSLKSGLASTSFKRARLELRDKGFIGYTSRGSQAPVYEMISLVRIAATVGEVVEEEVQEKVIEEQVTYEEVPVNGIHTMTLMREIMYGKEGWGESLLSYKTFEFHETHFGELSQHIADELFVWAHAVGDTLVYEALVRAVESGNVSWNYTKGILKKWQEANLVTMEDVLEAEELFRKKCAYGKYGKPPRKEILPDWFKRQSDVG